MVPNPSLPATVPSVGSSHPLEGTWRNQLGSTLTLHVDGLGGLQGTFLSGTAHSSIPVAVKGSYDPTCPPRDSTALGFVVDWTEVHAVTAWSGLYRPGEDTIRATWLMTAATDADREWRSTVLGHDLFQRQDD